MMTDLITLEDIAERTNDVLTTIRNRFGEPAAEFAMAYVAIAPTYMAVCQGAPREIQMAAATTITLLLKSATELAPFTKEQRGAYVQTLTGLIKTTIAFVGEPE